MWCSRGGWHRAGSPRCVSEPWLWVCAHRMQPGPAVMLWGEQQQQGWLQVMGRARGQATLPLYPPGSAAHPVPHTAPSQPQSKPRPPLAPHKFHTLGNPTGTAPPGTQHRAVLSPRNKTPQSWRSPGASLRGPKGAGTTRDAVHGACLLQEAARLPAFRGCCVPTSAPAPACPDPSITLHRLGRFGKTLSTISHLSSNTLITPQSWPPK